MGKLIETKYPDVNHRIFKKSVKKEKGDKKFNTKPIDLGKSIGLQQIKRKLASIDDEPISKLPKLRDGRLLETAAVPSPEDPIVVLKRDEITDLKIEVVQISDSEDVQLSVKEDASDLFLHDELRSSYENYVNKDFSFHIIDEINLEGLDGITIEALWKRFLAGLECPLNISYNLKEQMWQLICRNPKLQFFKLPEPRGVLDIYDRFRYVDTEMGVVMELAYELPDIYPHETVNHPNIQGSCATFTTRIDISSEVKNLPLKDAEEKYDRSLVIVADQKLRRNALVDETTDPNVEMVNLEYCILERIGRSRRHGELTQGNMSITSHFKMDPKSVYHYKKQLIQNNLLGKQFFYIKSVVTDQNKTGRLLHLRRFFHKTKPKQLLITEQIINLIKRKPDFRIEYSELRKIFPDNTQSMAKVVKSQEFHKYVKTDCLFPYRSLYPNAKRSEYMRKAQPVEKYIRCLELINPYVNVAASWNDQENSESDEDDDGEEDTKGRKVFRKEICNEVFQHILSVGDRGCSLQEIKKVFGVDNNTIRMALKKMVRRKIVNIRKHDKGKQRQLLYYTKSHDEPDVKVEPNPVQPILSKILSRNKQRRVARNVVKPQPPSTNPKKQLKLNCPFFIRDYSAPSILHDPYVRAEFSIPRTYLLSINSKLVQGKHTFQINQILSEITANLNLPRIKVNFDQIYTDKKNANYLAKLILLKAAFGEVNLSGGALNVRSHKRKRPIEMNVLRLSDNTEKSNGKLVEDDKLQYMGANPSVVFKEKKDDVCTEIILSTQPPAYKDESVYPKSADMSERVWSRMQTILKVVHDRRIFEDVYKMLKVIENDESITQGYKMKIDRKSLARLLKTLASAGYIKIYKLVLCDGKITKTQTFICHPSVDHTDGVIQTAYQQLKWRYFVGTQKKTAKMYVPTVQKELEEKIHREGGSPFNESDVMNSITELKEMNKLKIMKMKNQHNRSMGRTYGFKPKFIRMRIFHELLFYLIYSYNKETLPLSHEEVKSLFKDFGIDLTLEDLQNMPTVWSKEISWKMFIPPLPYHKSWKDGWALVCDVILRLPISVLCKVHNCSYEVPELIEVLNHPIKRFYLVKDLSESIRTAVLYRRKYIFSITEALNRLAYCGLLQFGPEKYKEKDQVFIYLNRRASVLDTTTSEPSYHKISNKEYVQIPFFFNSQADVDSYWYNVYGISLNTKLNAKQGGQLVTLVDVSAKPELLRALKSKTPEQAIEDDNGELPGDKRGASGLDSSLWSHIMRNWFWAHRKGKPPPAEPASNAAMGLRKEKLQKILPQNIPYNEWHRSQGPSKVYLHKSSKEAKEIKPKKSRKCVPMPSKTSKTLQRITRKIPFRQKKRERQYYDHIDKCILKKLGPIRVKWTDREDKALYLCLAASILLNPRFPKKQAVPYTVIRDVLQRICPESKNKTSRACQRRLKLHLQDMYPNLEDNVSDLFKMEPILYYFSSFVTCLLKGKTSDNKPFKLKESQLSAAFVILMAFLVQHEEEVVNIIQGTMMNVDHLTEENLRYVETNLIELEESQLKHQDPKDEDDVKRDALKAVIHSSLGSKTEPGWAFQLFKIYQKFSDNLIRDAVGEMKQSQTISFKKLMSKKDKIRWHTPFQLSNIYIYSQSSTFTETTAVEAYKTLLSVKERKTFLDFSQENIESKKYGQLLALNEFYSFWEKIQFEFYLPQSTVILNPHVEDHSELVDELAVRLQTKMKKMAQDSISEAEQEPETDTDNYRLQPGDMEMDVFKDNASTSHTTKQANLKPVDDPDTDDIHNSPLDLTVDGGNSETISLLKTWVTDCMEMKRERRSPSPDFTYFKEERAGKMLAKSDQDNDCNYDGEVEKIAATTTKKQRSKEQIPTLDEIKEGMLKFTEPNEDRIIPYITDLSSLLNRENFSELNTDEKTLERLKNHFVYQYALLEDYIIEDFEQLDGFYIMEYLQTSLRNTKIWDSIRCQMVVKEPAELSEVLELLKEKGGSQEDFDLAVEIVAFVQGKMVLGAKAYEIKERFRHSEKNVALEVILRVLTDAKILLQTGICTITFVHFMHQSTWLIETFALSSDEQRLLEEKTADEQKTIKENIELHLREKKLFRVKVMPWTKVDGTLSSENFKMWLSNVLSHCLDYPKIPFMLLCEKFCYIKPVDIFYILEVLQELNCLEILLYKEKEADLFSSWELTEEKYATFLDKFEDIYIAPNNISMTSLGSFFYEN